MSGANYKCNACEEGTTGFNHETGFETQSALRYLRNRVILILYFLFIV
jgi:hypothetical protein